MNPNQASNSRGDSDTYDLGAAQTKHPPKVVKGRGILRGVEVHQAQVVGDYPLEWVQVESALQARHRRNIQTLERAHVGI